MAGGRGGGLRPALCPESVFDLPALAESLGQLGRSVEHARAIQAHALKASAPNWRELRGNDLPKPAVEMLERDFARTTSTVAERRESTDGTIKMVIRLQDGMEVETVVIPMSSGYSTVCVSSQVGCAMGCTFCATGTMGLKGNLTAGEIVEQIVHARDAAPSQRVRNVVFMGMGEPLHNFDAVLAAVRTLADPKTFGLPKHGVTVSTVGVVPAIRRLAREAPWVRLAFSLHSPDQGSRQQIVPSASRFPLTDILAALDEYLAAAESQQVMIEFCVLRGKNDTPEDARRIGQLLSGRNAIVNLIPYNATEVRERYQEPTEESLLDMRATLNEEFGLLTTVRRHHGRDIGGACGQLALQRGGGTLLPDVEDAAAGCGPAPQSAGRLPEQRRLAAALAAAPAPKRPGWQWFAVLLPLALAAASLAAAPLLGAWPALASR